MCGICYAKSLRDKPVATILEERFQAQRNRGTEGFGYVEIKPDGAYMARSTSEELILKALRESEAREILFHHRFPTSTDNVINACHPFYSQDDDGVGYYLVHNGVLHNDDELKKEHTEKYGIKYVSIQKDGRYNDSECLVHEFMLYQSGKKPTFDAYGSIAIVVLQVDKDGKPEKLHFSRNAGSPLYKLRTRNTIQIASEGDGVLVPTGHLYTLDYETMKVSEVPFEMRTFAQSFKTYKPTPMTYGEYNDDGFWENYYNGMMSSRERDEDYDYLHGGKSIWKEHTEAYKEEQAKLLSIGDVMEAEDKDFDELNRAIKAGNFHALPVPPLMDLKEIYNKFMFNPSFELGLSDGDDGVFTYDDYTWITDLMVERNKEAKYLQDVLTLAQPEDDTQAIEDEMIDKSNDFLYWTGVATRMHELSLDF